MRESQLKIRICTVLGAGLAVLMIGIAACGDKNPDSIVARPDCQRFLTVSAIEGLDEGPCVLESSSVFGSSWTLLASWDKDPRAGTPGDGPCVYIEISTDRVDLPGVRGGAGWCDIPEGRLIGEWISRKLSPTMSIAWGPVSAGAIAQVRIDFADGSPVVVEPKPTPWSEFDYWFATFVTDRKPTALVAVNSGGTEIAREDVSRRPPDPGF